MSETADVVVGWYENHARKLFKKWSEERVEGLDGEVSRLQKLRAAAEQPFQTCFLGNSGVGKSTLINALVDDRIPALPQGGIGPLTALATRVKYSAEPYFRVRYHTGQKLNRLLFVLERHLVATQGSRLGTVPASAEELGLTLEEQVEAEAALPLVDAERSGDPGEGSSIVEAYMRVASLLVRGAQFDKGSSNLGYLTSGLRAALDLPLKIETTFIAEDAVRIDGLKMALASARSGLEQTVRLESDRKVFLRRLLDHAAGFLAPLIHTLEVGWPADVLTEGLVLVDLPGLGIANDEYRTVTASEIRSARVVCLVVDRSGVTEASADLLRSTGFLNSLLHEAGDDEADPPILLVAVVKLDLTADDERSKDKVLGENTGKKWIEYFDDACAKAEVLVRAQLRGELTQPSDVGSQLNRATKDEIIGRVLDSLQVLPVSALQHRLFHADDEDDPAKIKQEEQSRIPGFRKVLSGAAKARNARLSQQVEDLANSITTRIRAAVEVIGAQWEAVDRAEEEAQRLREELDVFLKPKQREFVARQAEYRAFLNETMKATIHAAVGAATEEARKSIRKYLNKLRGYHWATLRAAVRRGGVFVGSRQVDFPNDFTLIFEEPLAIVWSKDILVPLRKRTRELGEDHVSMVGEVADWARSKGATVNAKLVEGLSEEVREQTQQFADVGKELVKELRDGVKDDLYKKVEHGVRARCAKFVAEKQTDGIGVKGRMLEFFAEELTDAVIETAASGAIGVMEKNFEKVAAEIRELLKKHPNPLDEAADQIVERHEVAVRRRDEVKQKRVLEEVRAVLNAAPTQRVA